MAEEIFTDDLKPEENFISTSSTFNTFGQSLPQNFIEGSKSHKAHLMKQKFIEFRNRLKQQSIPRINKVRPPLRNQPKPSDIISNIPKTPSGVIQLRAAEELAGGVESGVLVAGRHPFPGGISRTNKKFGVTLHEANSRGPSSGTPLTFNRNSNQFGHLRSGGFGAGQGNFRGAIQLLNERLGPGGSADFDRSIIVDFLSLVSVTQPQSR